MHSNSYYQLMLVSGLYFKKKNLSLSDILRASVFIAILACIHPLKTAGGLAKEVLFCQSFIINKSSCLSLQVNSRRTNPNLVYQSISIPFLNDKWPCTKKDI